MIVEKLKGAFTALITPFDERNRVDVPALKRLVERQIQQGINGLVPCGTTGEAPVLSVDEQEVVVRTVIEVTAGRVPVVAGTGSNNTAATAAQTARARTWGVDAALVVCPYYNKPTQEGLYHHFKAVAEDGGLPVIAYNVPGRTITDLQPETLGRLQSDGHIVAVKDATASMIRTTETVGALDPRKPFALMSGDDFTILPFVACGGVGVISVASNIAPGDVSRLVALSAEANYAEARPLHARVLSFSRVLFSAPNPTPIKAALALAGWCRPDCRLPLLTADAKMMAAVRKGLAAYAGTDDFEGYMS
ncbi:MAG: 4-hydroxy-tetrahydrodipicolinate synthase [Myxococcota bacterium]